MSYVFDNSPLSALFRNYYRKTFPSLWQRFDQLVDDGRLVSTREVFREIEDGPSESLLEWAKNNRALFATPTAEEGAFVAPNRTPAAASPAEASLRDRRSTHPGIERRELARERRQCLVHDAANGPQRVVLADPRFQIDVADSDPDRSSPPRIHSPPPKPRQRNHRKVPLASDFFNGPLVLLCHKHLR